MSAGAQNQGRSKVESREQCPGSKGPISRAVRETSLWQRSSTMKTALLTCDCDCVIEMEKMAVGVPEILQFASLRTDYTKGKE